MYERKRRSYILMSLCLIFMLVILWVSVDSMIQIEKLVDRVNEIQEEKNECVEKIISLQKVQELASIREKPPEELSSEEQINDYIFTICSEYDVDPFLIQSIVWHESNYIPTVANGNCLGLMQVSSYWHADRAERLGVTDFYDPYSNILLGVDFIAELQSKHKDDKLVLMLYNMKWKTAYNLYNKGIISDYAQSVLAMRNELKLE